MIPFTPGWPTLAAAALLVTVVVLSVAAVTWALWELLGPARGAHAAPAAQDEQPPPRPAPGPIGSMILAAEQAGYDEARDGGWISGSCSWDDRRNGGTAKAATGGPPWEPDPGTFPALSMGGRGMPGPAPDPLAWLDRLTADIIDPPPELAHDEYRPFTLTLAPGWEFADHVRDEQPPPRPEYVAELAALDHDTALYLARLRSGCAEWRASWTPATGEA